MDQHEQLNNQIQLGTKQPACYETGFRTGRSCPRTSFNGFK